jgi:hypothetical protein
MPKRYIIEWDPPVPASSSSGTSRASFDFQGEERPHDACPERPRKEDVDNALRTSPKAKDKREWTCGEIHDILGLTLRPH